MITSVQHNQARFHGNPQDIVVRKLIVEMGISTGDENVLGRGGNYRIGREGHGHWKYDTRDGRN